MIKNYGENEIIEKIDRVIKEKQESKLAPGKSPTIKKNELEAYLEGLAKASSIQFTKKSSALKTMYLAEYNNRQVQLELFYRYSNFYTRHQAIILSDEIKD
ncbi:hypothetical protein DRW41_16380 [Neobacillus piezotolerans]|uniref:Uncharacterized protein n=1 Tax=Neobacillus piezotolerans TaxID=2259171 RepID=A0A3D8GNA7_9BACI|nr:hypothetical protein [Neobacillus piezotolerans]RDU35719.1 hypothetical protein DRW41_16380 [Neobacillus piezotolerans]